MERRRSRRFLIATRWQRIVAISVFTCVVGFLLGYAERANLAKAYRLPDWWLLIVPAAAVALLLALSPLRFLASLGLRHPLAYPPYWFGVALGLATALLLISNGCSADFGLDGDAVYFLSTGAIFVASIPLGLITIAIAGSFGRRVFRKAVVPAPPWPQASVPSLDEFLRWIATDSAVESPAADLFGHSTIAQRMGKRLSAKEPAAQAVVGKLGSGKSTVRALVERYLSEQGGASAIKVVKVELWPFESPRAAVEGILATVVEALSTEVRTTQLEGLPAAYGETIAKLGGVSEWLPRVPRRPETPASSLQGLDDVATSIGRRYVLWVEDLERFAAGDPNLAATNSELERLAPIRAVLHGLDQLKSITVVTATTDLFRRFDMEKIARYVERIPELKFRQSRRIISAIREELLAKDKVVDPVAPRARAQFGWKTEDDAKLEYELLGDKIINFASAVSSLATTPRILKQGLRRVLETWSILKGEMDVDEMIALSIIQEAYPSVFALIEQRAVGLRGRRPSRRNEPDPMDSFTVALALLEMEPQKLEAVTLIVKEIFSSDSRRRPQGIANNNHADYLSRFLSTPTLDATQQDQPILRTLLGTDDELIVDELVGDRSGAVEDFVDIIPIERLDRMLLKLTRRVLHGDLTMWQENRPPGLVPLWRMMRTKSRGREELSALESEVLRAIELAVPVNLLLAHELAYWLATSVPEVSDLLPPETRANVNKRLRDVFVSTYRGRPGELAERFKGTPPFLLVWLCWSMERVRAKNTFGVPFPEWSELLPTLLNALEAHPAVMATQLAPLVVRQNRRFAGPDEWLFDEDQCRILFGDVDQFVAKLKNATGGIEVDARTLAVVQRQTQPRPEDEHEDDLAGVGDVAQPAHGVETYKYEGGAEQPLGALPGQVEGFWFESLDQVPATRPDQLPSAVLPEKPDLGDGSFALFLVDDYDVWTPLAVEMVSNNTIAQALSTGESRYFMVEDASDVYQASFEGQIAREQVLERYGEAARDGITEERHPIVIRLVRVADEKRRAMKSGAAPAVAMDTDAMPAARAGASA